VFLSEQTPGVRAANVIKQPGKIEMGTPGATQEPALRATCEIGICNALDNSRRVVHPLAIGRGHLLHHGGINPHPAARGSGDPGDQPGFRPKRYYLIRKRRL
jgi:hypothetical protein